MNNTERTGPDIRVALNAAARELSPEPMEARREQNSSSSPPAKAAIDGPASGGGEPSIKVRLRSAVGRLYRAAKPVLRPAAFRLRSYLVAPLLAEIRSAAEERHRAIFGGLHSLRVLIEHNKQLQRNELASIGLQLIQENQFARDALTQTLNHRQLRLDAFLARLQSSEEAFTARLERAEQAFAARLERIEQYAYASARRVAVPGAPGEVLVRSSVGYLLCPASDYPLLATLVDAGELGDEVGTRLLIQKLLRPGETFVDVGANIGMHTLAAASAMQSSGRIIAFEPHPMTHDLLRKSLVLNGFAGMTETHQVAASNRTGHLPLHLGPTCGHHSLYPLEGAGQGATTIDVPLVRIDDMIDASTSVDLMKIDVEGAELDVIEGAATTIGRNADLGIIMEFGHSHVLRAGHTTTVWLRALESFGLAFRAIDPASGSLLEWTAGQLEAVDSINLLFARPTSKVWARAQGNA
ncbi:methyltransferase, FkbM family [Variovorax sp. PBL-H6]|uniref:FkbM family methyltransferase n=1 Tax=Variovorax sp. PBL-H6 TaxID=434009 RepID=UPI001318EB67|nr:FkbM family methyltransferase [Variovorax sp. PBL-H6]VTU17454.1 methyltransferase, FkbM family [Variovorax sp. PBL-H6]